MGFVGATKTCFRKYAVFSGRAGRAEYWWFALFIMLVSVVLLVLDGLLFGGAPDSSEAQKALSSIFQLAVLIPLLAAGWRRLHDTGRPGWLLLLPMVSSVLTVAMLLSGVVVFGVLEQNVADADTLRGPAAVLGVTGMLVAYGLQLVLAVAMVWWLTRPSDKGDNEFGPAPV